jgi:hypothetical protein
MKAQIAGHEVETFALGDGSGTIYVDGKAQAWWSKTNKRNRTEEAAYEEVRRNLEFPNMSDAGSDS